MDTHSFEIVIPAHNEEANIGGVINEIRAVMGAGCPVIVIDDASADRTGEIAAASGARVIRHPYRMGNGASVKTGLRNAAADMVVIMDADGQHQPCNIPLLLKQMENFDMAIAARDFRSLSPRTFANIVYNSFAGYVTRFKIKDLTCGFRIVKRKLALKFLYLLPNGFSSPSTLTLAFLKAGRSITYVPVSSVRRAGGKSKINIIGDGARFFVLIIRIATFFSPLRVFVPVSLLFFLSGLGYYLHTFIHGHRFTNMSALLLTASIIIFMLGLVSEQIAQLRMDRTEG
ncbi:MAG: glycosyltransferase family 2 protein [Candidatus Omnitrophica bacterium]|nr:glycosyltransferase family 2 protein [Candidatus Omnitrophota bacterium]